MNSATPLLATAMSRVGAGVIDFAPALLLICVAAGIVEKLGLGSGGMALSGGMVFVAYHAYFSYHWSGETPGRRAFDIRVVGGLGSGELTVAQCILRPTLKIVWLVSFLPVAILLRNPWYCVIPMVVDLFLMTSTPWRRTIADLICRTIVIRTPPPQPHRAPAGPMYSATDAEFGVIPVKK